MTMDLMKPPCTVWQGWKTAIEESHDMRPVEGMPGFLGCSRCGYTRWEEPS